MRGSQVKVHIFYSCRAAARKLYDPLSVGVFWEFRCFAGWAAASVGSNITICCAYTDTWKLDAKFKWIIEIWRVGTFGFGAGGTKQSGLIGNTKAAAYRWLGTRDRYIFNYVCPESGNEWIVETVTELNNGVRGYRWPGFSRASNCSLLIRSTDKHGIEFNIVLANGFGFINICKSNFFRLKN